MVLRYFSTLVMDLAKSHNAWGCVNTGYMKGAFPRFSKILFDLLRELFPINSKLSFQVDMLGIEYNRVSSSEFREQLVREILPGNVHDVQGAPLQSILEPKFGSLNLLLVQMSYTFADLMMRRLVTNCGKKKHLQLVAMKIAYRENLTQAVSILILHNWRLETLGR